MKYKENHCTIFFCSEGNQGFLIEKEIIIEDLKTLAEIIEIGYTRNDMQDLFKTKYYSYLSTDILVLNSIHSEKEKRALKFINKLLKEKKDSIPTNCYCIEFNFPRKMIENKKDGLVKIKKK